VTSLLQSPAPDETEPADDEWARLITFQWHGASVGVRSNDGATLDELQRVLPPGARIASAERVAVLYSWTVTAPDPAGRTLHVISRRCAHHTRPRELVRTAEATTALVQLVHDAEFRVAIHAPACLFVHAAAVAWKGRVIVLPGHSHAGKSTLTAALVRHGALYFSDEYSVIDEEGLVHPFPRRLHMRSSTGGRSTDVPVEELGGIAGTEPLPIGMIVATKYRPGSQWRPGPMSSGQAALALFDNAIVARMRPAHTMTRIARALDLGAVGMIGPRGEADDTARRLLAVASRTFEATGRRPGAP
jgi:hypothetical protein